MKVSIGISFYNAEKYLSYSIKSVLNQTFKDFELILINDGSTDNSLEIAKNYNDPRIRIYSDGLNKGLAERLNELVRMSQGEYFARMDADDIMHYNRIQEQVNFLESHKEIDVLGSDVYTINTRNEVKGKISYERSPNNIEDICKHRCFIHPSIMAKRQWFLDNPYNVDAIRMEDFELWTRTFNHYHFYNLPTHLLFYRTEGLPYLSKYLKSERGERKILKSIEKKYPICKKYILKNYFKCIAYTIFSLLKLTDVLLKLRSKKLNLRNQSYAEKDLTISIL